MRNFNLSDWALKHQQFVLYLILIFLAAGVFSYLTLGRKEDPEFTFKLMVVKWNCS
jgi:multidrug efflux pump